MVVTFQHSFTFHTVCLASTSLALRLRWWSTRRVGLWLARPCIRQPAEVKQGQTGSRCRNELTVLSREFVLDIWQPWHWEPSYSGWLLTAWKHKAIMGTWAGGRVRQPWLRSGASTRSHIRHSRARTAWRAGQRGLWCWSLARHPASTCSQVESVAELVAGRVRGEGPLVRVPCLATHLHLQPVRQLYRDRWLAVSDLSCRSLVGHPTFACREAGSMESGSLQRSKGRGERKYGAKLWLASPAAPACRAETVWQPAPKLAFCSMPG